MKMKTIPWTEAEDDDLRRDYNRANGAFPTYQQQADQINKRHHGGKPVRSAASVTRRDGRVNYGK